MAINLQNLEYFYTCVECGSFRAAADKLFRSYQSIYQGVHQLEQDLGSPLFLSENGNLVLTDFGHYTLTHYVTPLLNDLRQLNDSLDTYRRDKYTTLRVEIDKHFPKWVKAAQQAADILQSRHPQAKISCTPESPFRILDHLRENTIEFGMRHSTPQSADLTKALSTYSELYLLAAPSHRLAGQTSISPDDVRTELLLFHNPDTCSKMSLWELTGLSRKQAVVMPADNPLTAELFNQGKLLRPFALPQGEKMSVFPYIQKAVWLPFDPPVYVESCLFYNPSLKPTDLMREYLRIIGELLRRQHLNIEIPTEAQ